MEVPALALERARWHKSSFSGAQQGCVEVAELSEGTAVRDTKSPTAGTLLFPQRSWSSFNKYVKDDHLSGTAPLAFGGR